MSEIKHMHHSEAIQQAIDHIHAENYLEIGIWKGQCFFSIRAPHKFGVDPVLYFSLKRKVREIGRNWTNIFNSYHPVKSDEFFKNIPARIEKTGIDVAFIDGLHTHEQAYQDVLNTQKYLNKDGIIIMHDCNPTSEAMAFPAESIEAAREANPPGWTNEWCGDVWKTIPLLRVTQPDIGVHVLDCDYGLGVISNHKSSDEAVSFSEQDVARWTYSDLEANRKKILNLVSPDYFQTILKKIG